MGQIKPFSYNSNDISSRAQKKKNVLARKHQKNQGRTFIRKSRKVSAKKIPILKHPIGIEMYDPRLLPWPTRIPKAKELTERTATYKKDIIRSVVLGYTISAMLKICWKLFW